MDSYVNPSSDVQTRVELLKVLDLGNTWAILDWLEQFFQLWSSDETAASVRYTVAMRIGVFFKVLPDPFVGYKLHTKFLSGDEFAEQLVALAFDALTDGSPAISAEKRLKFMAFLSLWRGDRW